jgi:hypothetical protein
VQPTPDGKAIWRATVTGGSGWTQSFTFLRLAPALIWEADERPVPFVGSVHIEDAGADSSSEVPRAAIAPLTPSLAESNSTDISASPTASASNSTDDMSALLSDAHVESVSARAERADTETDSALAVPALYGQQRSVDAQPQNALSVASDEPVGMRFVSWLRAGIQARRLIINDAKALVHISCQPRSVSALRTRTSRSRPARKTDRSSGVGVDAKAIREAASSQEAGQRSQHLDVRGGIEYRTVPNTHMSSRCAGCSGRNGYARAADRVTEEFSLAESWYDRPCYTCVYIQYCMNITLCNRALQGRPFRCYLAAGMLSGRTALAKTSWVRT